MAIEPQQLSMMIDLLYAAALDPLRWGEFLSSFASAVGSESAALFVHDFSNRQSTFENELALGASVNLDPAYMATFDYFSTVNPWTAREGDLAEGVAVTGCMLVPARELVERNGSATGCGPKGFPQPRRRRDARGQPGDQGHCIAAFEPWRLHRR